jgi:hypothetical protein
MKKFIVAIGVLLLGIVSCENDDFCTEPTTPRLIISFYDKDTPEEYKELPIYVWALEKDSIYNLATVDSIYVPFNTNATTTSYALATTNIIDTLKFNYTVEDVFVSEPCGYKSVFSNLTIDTKTNNWISSIEVTNQSVDNEEEAHVKIYY